MERKRNPDIPLFYCDCGSSCNYEWTFKRILGSPNKVPIEVFMGIVLIFTGIWTKLTAEDYYIDEEGRKKYLENDLFFIKMKTWGLILPLTGAGLIIYGVNVRDRRQITLLGQLFTNSKIPYT